MRSCIGQKAPCRAAHTAVAAAATALLWRLVNGKLTNTQRTFPVEMYSRSIARNVSSAKRRQYGHWKSDISYTVTGAEGEPLARVAEAVEDGCCCAAAVPERA